MVSGVPTSGKRTRYARWTVEQLYGLYQRWHAGENLQDIAKSVGTSRGRLRSAMDYHGLKAPNRSRLPKYPNASKPLATPPAAFSAEDHRSARHYKGSFDL